MLAEQDILIFLPQSIIIPIILLHTSADFCLPLYRLSNLYHLEQKLLL